MAISVEAMPAAVYCTAISEKPTPTKGPKMVVAVATESPSEDQQPQLQVHHEQTGNKIVETKEGNPKRLPSFVAGAGIEPATS